MKDTFRIDVRDVVVYFLLEGGDSISIDSIYRIGEDIMEGWKDILPVDKYRVCIVDIYSDAIDEFIQNNWDIVYCLDGVIYLQSGIPVVKACSRLGIRSEEQDVLRKFIGGVGSKRGIIRWEDECRAL